jgi:hypothetical protein
MFWVDLTLPGTRRKPEQEESRNKKKAEKKRYPNR